MKPETAIKHNGGSTMKKTILGILSIAIAASVCVGSAFAAGPGRGYRFVDAGGICGNLGSRCAYTDEDGDGVCDVCGADHAQAGGGNFTDADGDGVCDYCASGRGCGYGRGAQDECGNGFRGGRSR